MDGKAGRDSIAGACLCGLLTGVLIESKWVFQRPCFFPRKKEIVYRLTHKSRFRNLGNVHLNLFCNLWQRSHCCKLILGDGNLHLVMFTEVSPHLFDHVPYMNWDFHLSQKIPPRLTPSTWLSPFVVTTRSTMWGCYSERRKLLGETSYWVKENGTRNMSDYQLIDELLDGS